MRKLQLLSLLLLAFSLQITTAFAQEDKLENTLLWQISGNGLDKPSYLFGTVHLQDKRVFNFNDSVIVKLLEVDAFAMELLLDEIDMEDMVGFLMLEDGVLLSDLLEPKDYKKVKKFVEKQLEGDMAIYDRMKPLGIWSMAMASYMHFGTGMSLSVDEYLHKRATLEGKSAYGLETVKEQFDALESIEVPLLINFIDEYETQGSITDDMIDAYIAEDINTLYTIVSDTTSVADFAEILLVRRNYNMVERIMKLTRTETVFIAVGTGHLAGKEGLINLLRAEGYTVTPVLAAHTLGTAPDIDELDGYEDEAEDRPTTKPARTESTAHLAKNEYQLGYATVTFNGKATKTQTPYPTSWDDDLTIDIYNYSESTALGEVNYIFMTTPLQEDITSAGDFAIESFFKGMMEKLAEKFKGKSSSVEKFSINGFNAGKATMTSQQYTIGCQVVLAADKVYVQMVLVPNKKVKPSFWQPFFNTFKMLDQQ